MNGEKGNGSHDDDVVEDVGTADESEGIVMSDDIDDDNVGDMSVELNVEELVADIKAIEDDEHKQEIHRRLEELNDEREAEKELDSTYDFNLDDEL